MAIKTNWFFSNRLRGESHPKAKLTSKPIVATIPHILST